MHSKCLRAAFAETLILPTRKVLLGSAECIHGKPQNEWNHAPVIAKADAAKSNTETALTHFKTFCILP